MITILTAWDDNRLIGCNNKLPWHIPADLKLFKKRTKGQTVIMGRKTWESIGSKPLPGRLNIVLTSRNLDVPDAPDDETFTYVTDGLDDAIYFYGRHRPFRDREAYIIGGAQIYEAALMEGWTSRMLISVIPGRHEGSTYFPNFDGIWNRHVIERYDEFRVEEWTLDEK